MKKQYGILGVCAVLFLFAGCVTLTAEGENVTVTNDASVVSNCTKKGTIRSYAVLEMNAICQIRNIAPIQIAEDEKKKEWTANTVLVGESHSPEGEGFWTDFFSTEIDGTAYSCN